MTAMDAILLYLVAVPLFLCATHAVLNRLPGALPHTTPFTAGKVTALMFVPLYVVLHLMLFGFHWLPMLCGLAFVLIYLGCVIFLNWFIFTLTDVSMHIQLMMQLHRVSKIPIEQLVERYNKDTILRNRVPRLLELGQLKLVDGRLTVSGGSVLFGAFVCQLMRRILGIPLRPEDADHTS